MGVVIFTVWQSKYLTTGCYVYTSQGHFVSNWFDVDSSQFADKGTIDTSVLDSALASSITGIAIGLLRSFVIHWKQLSTSVKFHIISWNSEILTEIRPYRDVSDLQLWNTLKRAISSAFHQLITIAGSASNLLCSYLFRLRSTFCNNILLSFLY